MGKEQNNKFYDSAFITDRNYLVHYTKCNYYQLWKIIIERMNDIVDKNKKIIELGCGVGQFAHFLFDSGYKNYLGYDFSYVAIEKAFKTSEQSFICLDFFKRFNIDGDIYILLEVLEHLEKDIELLNKIPFEKLIIITVPNFDGTAHVRFFNNEIEIRERYANIINIKEIYKYTNHFLIIGERNNK